MSSKLVLIDGHAAVYRAFFAIKGLSTRQGKPTNAVFGFVRMINQIKDACKPDYLGVVFDGGLPEERLALIPDYKAQRERMPDDLRVQFETIDKYLNASRIPSVVINGQEADDILAAMAFDYYDLVDEILIVTRDKDLFQIVNDKIKMVSLSGGYEETGVSEVIKKTGVEPSQVIDWLSMIGDSADNIKGVPGIGVKTATSLLQQFHCIDEIYERIDEIKSDRIRSALKENRHIVARNIDMIRLNRNIDHGLKLSDLKYVNPDYSRLLNLFRELEFDGMAKEIEEPDLFT